MKKTKHNKKRNTAFLYEALIREMTKAVVSKNKEQKNKIVDITSAGAGLSNSAWNEGDSAPVGSIPTTAHVVAVEYVKQNVGSATGIYVQVSGETFAFLTEGESVVIPMHMGEAVADIEIFDTNYSDGAREAIVNVMIAGV